MRPAWKGIDAIPPARSEFPTRTRRGRTVAFAMGTVAAVAIYPCGLLGLVIGSRTADVNKSSSAGLQRVIERERLVVFRCAGELRVVVRSNPLAAARSLRVDPATLANCQGNRACVEELARREIDAKLGAAARYTRMTPGEGSQQAPDPLLPTRVAGAHLAADDLCRARDQAVTIASMAGRHPSGS